MDVAQALDALREAYRAASCVRWMLVHLEDAPMPQRYFTHSELTALHAVIGSEVERRLQIVRLAVASAATP